MFENKNDKMKLKGIECNNKTNKKAKKKYICKRPADLFPYYLFVADKKTWADARDYCVAEGMHLATIEDSDTFVEAWQFVLSNFSEFTDFNAE